MISSHAARPVPRDPSAESATRGFGNIAFPKLIRLLRDPQFEVRFKALQVAEELLANPKTLAQCVDAGICVVFAELLQDEHEQCQELVADRLRYVMRTPSSAAAATVAGVLPLILVGMTHNNAAVRHTYYRTLLECLRHEQQRHEVVDISIGTCDPAVQQLLMRAFPSRRIEIEGGSNFPAVTFLLACAMRETNGGNDTPCLGVSGTSVASALPLQLLEKLAQKRDNQTVLETLMQAGDLVAYLTSLLAAPYLRQVHLAAVKLLTTICSTGTGKLAAVKAGCVVNLVSLTTTGHMEITVAATGALAMITTSAAGKQALLETGEVLLFLELLDWSNLSLERNILSIIANAAENPEMREILREHGVNEYLAPNQFSYSFTIRKARGLAAQQVVFEHRPHLTIPQY